MITIKSIPVSALPTLLLVGTVLLTGCETEGPAEKAGAQIDKGVQNAKDAISPPGPMEKAGRAIDKAAKD